MSLRRRVLAYLALATVLSCALTVAVAVVLVHHRLTVGRVTLLESQADVLAVVGGPPGARAAGEHVFRIAGGQAHRVTPELARAVLTAVPRAGDDHGRVRADGRTLLYAARQTTRGRIVLIRSSRLAFSEWRPFLTSLVLAGLGGAVVAALLAAALARRLTRPISALSTATRRVAAGEAGVTVPVDGADELAGLGRSFNAMSAQLEQARGDQQRFLESVSHELKTPLTSVRGYAEALAEEAIAGPEGGRVIAAEADRLQRLIADLVDLGRLGRAGFTVSRAPVDLAAIVAAVLERHRPGAQALQITLSADAEVPAGAIGDAGRLLQATSNLVENALRFTPAGGTVTVTARPGTITVDDTGPGLAPDDLPRAFERFYLHDRYRSTRPVGTGLGLAIVAELVAAMEGRVGAESLAGGGARFTIAVAPAPAPTDRSARVSPAG